MKLHRKSEPIPVDAIRFMRVSAPIRVGSRPPVLYEVGDSFPLEASNVQHQNDVNRHDPYNHPEVGSTSNYPEFMAVVCRPVVDDSYLLPSMEPLIAFPPIPGTGSYSSGSIRLSVIFWDGEFWSPVLAVEPERPALFAALYGIVDGWGLDVLYRVEAEEVPSVMGAIGREPDDPVLAPWIGLS